MQDHFPQAKDYLSGLAIKAEGLIMAQWENLKTANLFQLLRTSAQFTRPISQRIIRHWRLMKRD